DHTDEGHIIPDAVADSAPHPCALPDRERPGDASVGPAVQVVACDAPGVVVAERDGQDGRDGKPDDCRHDDDDRRGAEDGPPVKTWFCIVPHDATPCASYK